MLAFANPAGLLLLLLIPLLLFFRRRKAQPRRRVLTSFFLLEALRRRPARTRLRLLRLTRAQRFAVVAAILLCLSLALAETALILRRPPPERWLLVVDNTPVAAARAGGVVIASAVRDFLAEVAGAAVQEDLVTIMTTSPAPSVRTVAAGGGELRERLGAIAPAERSAPLETLLPLVKDLAVRHGRTLILSPRAGLWRPRIGRELSEGRIVVPEDGAVARGNRGIVGVRLRTSAAEEGRYDLYVAVRSSLEREGTLPLSLSPAGGAAIPAAVTLHSGAGHMLLESLQLPPGELRIALLGGDAFPGDDRVRLAVPGQETVGVSVHGERSAILGAAVASHRGYRLVKDGEAEVDIHLGEAPSPLVRPALLVFPVRDRSGLRVRDLVPVRAEPRWHPDHAATRALRSGSFRPSKILALDVDARHTALAEAGGVPFLLAVEGDGPRLLVWAFDPLEGGLFAKPEFLILFRESLDWLAGRSEVPPHPQPDELTTDEAAEVTLPKPDPASFRRERSARRRVDLLPWLVGAALLLGGVLAASDLSTPNEEGAAS